MARIEKTVFISYRRKDIAWALAVYQYLTRHNYDVFFDYTSIRSGDFEQIIVSNIKARAHFVLILTPSALDRCNEPDDWLRREVETALDEKRNIIPLFFDGFSFSSPAIAEQLTGRLGAIQRYNGLDVPSGYFVEAMERLRGRYLNMPLNAVLHPISSEVQEVVKEEQSAANKALLQQWKHIKALIQPGPGAKRNQIWIYGRLIVIILLISGFFGPWFEVSSCTPAGSPPQPPTVYAGGEAYLVLLGWFPFSIIPVAMSALFLLTILRLLPWKFAASKVLVRSERLAAGFAPLSTLLAAFYIIVWLWGLWSMVIGVYLAPFNLLLELNSKRQRGEKWPLWAWLLATSIILSLSILLYFWLRYFIAKLKQ